MEPPVMNTDRRALLFLSSVLMMVMVMFGIGVSFAGASALPDAAAHQRATRPPRTVSTPAASGASAALTQAAATLQSLGTPSAGGGASTMLTQAAATIQAISTVSMASIQATAMAAVGSVNADAEAALIAQLEAWAVYGTLDVQSSEGLLLVTYTLSEAEVNQAVDAALAAAGYAYSVTVDLGVNTVTVTLGNITLSSSQTGTLALTFTLGLDADGYTLVLTSATLNGRPIPTESVEALLDEAIAAIVNTVLLSVPDDAASAAGSISYDVQSVTISQDAVTLVVAITVPEA